MNCKDFQFLMKDFLFHNIKDETVLEEALKHVKSCKSCYEELELYYILNIGMEKIERDETNAYDFTGDLDRMIYKYSVDLAVCHFVRGFSHAATVLASWVLAAFLVLQLLIWVV
ncbi:MAG: hypothetical protein LUE29_10225 [Lachnospiraceae bacterium]|nr:hypothetical protein [Lachnospiraceae bacterium]